MITQSVHETEALGEALAEKLLPGDVVLLRGELGAGKTAFSRGVARGLGVSGPVTSPTFSLLNCHQARIPLHHFDLYRLTNVEEFEIAGLADYVGGRAVSLIEWPERCEGALPECRLEVTVDYGSTDFERVIQLTPVGGFREVVL